MQEPETSLRQSPSHPHERRDRKQREECENPHVGPSLELRLTPGIYLVHKPVGQTSFALVQAFMDEVRRAGVRRDRLPVCHGGALDPFAEGLVLLLAGQATRLMDLLHDVPKTHEAAIAWGAEADNGDPLGRGIATGD